MSSTTNNAEQPVPENVRDQVFKQIRSINKNNMCIDCQKKNPKWASIHLGVYLCIDCAGKHRQYGVVYSFVKSTNLDVWNRKQLLFMQKGGNARALQYLRKCGVINDTHKHIDYKSPIVQKYKSILTAEVEAQLSGIPQASMQKQSQKKKSQTNDEFDDDNNDIKKPKEIPNAQVVQQQAKGKKKTKKKIGTKINLEDFDTMEFDDGVPTQQKEKIIRAYQNNSKKQQKLTQSSMNVSSEQKVQQVAPVQVEPEKARELSEQQSKKKLQQLKAKQNVKSISSQEFKDTSLDQQRVKQNLNKFQGSSSISSSAFFGNEQEAQDDGSVTKIKDFVSDAGGKIYEKLSGYWSKN